MNVNFNYFSDDFVLPSCDCSLNIHDNILDAWLDDRL